MEIDYLSSFLLGIGLGWGPCLISCLPIVVPYVIVSQKGAKRGFYASIIFSIGRVFSYTIIGVLAAGFSQIIGRMFFQGYSPFITYTKFILRCLIFTIAVFILIGKDLPIFRFISDTFRQRYKPETQGYLCLFIIGILWGLRPCAPLIGVLTYIVCVSRLWWQGLFLGLCFGIGTLFSPLLIFGALSSKFSKWASQYRYISFFLRWLCGIIFILLALFGIR